MVDHGDTFIASLDLRVSEILDRCTRCARCVEVCPTAGPAGIDTREPVAGSCHTCYFVCHAGITTCDLILVTIAQIRYSRFS